MNSLEKRVWAVAYVLYWKEGIEDVSRMASRGDFRTGAGTVNVNTGEEKTEQDIEMDLREAEEIRATTSAVEWADQAVHYLRLHQKDYGSFHVDEDLELERQAEEDIIGR
jgi:hypothetical protein